MFRIPLYRVFRRCVGILSILVLLATSLGIVSTATAASLKTVSFGGQAFLSYSTRLPLVANPTRYSYSLLSIEGGTRPYSISMSNPILEIRPLPNGFQYEVFTKKVGTTIITIKDSTGKESLNREVIVYDPNSLPLVLGSLPDASNPVAVGQGRGFGVSQGNPPYTVVSANPGIARIEGPSQAGIWTAWGTSAGSTTITVTDASGARAQGTVFVGTTKPLLISADATLLTGGKGELNISSGNPPYTVTTSAHLSAVLKGNDSYGRTIYTLTAKSAGQGTVTIKDSKGLTASKAVTVKDWVTLSFPQLTGDLRTIDVGQTTKLVVAGGIAPYTVTADNPALVTIAQQGAGQYTVTGRQAGVVGFTAKDASGITRSLSLTVRTLPTLTLAAPDTMLIGVTGSLSLIGGAPPFAVTVSGDQLALTKIDDKKYTLTPKSPGKATITVKDGKGTTMQKVITVNAPALRLETATEPLQVGYTRPLDIKGGTGPYTLTLSNTNAKAALVATNPYTRYNITGAAPGVVDVSVKDSRGATAGTRLTVVTAQNPLKLIVSSNTLQLGATGAAAIRTLSIQGGTAPYALSVSGSQLTLTQVGANQYQMIPRSPGNATITVRDNKGNTASQAITVQAPGVNPLTILSATTARRGQTVEVRLNGGTAPYRLLQNSGPPVQLRQISANVFQVTPTAQGLVVLQGRDAQGQSATANLNVMQ